jgi:hypothetical protein
MGAGAVVTSSGAGGYHHLLNPNRKWYNNKRYVWPKCGLTMRHADDCAASSRSTDGSSSS